MKKETPEQREARLHAAIGREMARSVNGPEKTGDPKFDRLLEALERRYGRDPDLAEALEELASQEVAGPRFVEEEMTPEEREAARAAAEAAARIDREKRREVENDRREELFLDDLAAKANAGDVAAAQAYMAAREAAIRSRKIVRGRHAK